MSKDKVLVTGGNGHLGNTLVKMLCNDGYDVRVSVRNPSDVRDAGIFEDYDVELVEADIRDQQAMSNAIQGVEGVFQVAALYHYDEQSLGEGIVENNTQGTEVVLSLAKEHGVRRTIFTSSIAAVGFDGSESTPLNEDNWSDPTDPYCISKLKSEQAAWKFSQDHNLDLIALCPSIIIGPNFYKHTPSTVNISSFVNNQLPFRFPMACSLVDVRDVARAHILAYESNTAHGRYILSGTHLDDLLEVLATVDGDMVIPERELSLEEARKLAEKAGTPVELVGRPFWYSDERARQELTWTTRPIEKTLKDTVDWIRKFDL